MQTKNNYYIIITAAILMFLVIYIFEKGILFGQALAH